MTESTRPISRLTLDRPDIWKRGLALATSVTGYSYLPKLPLGNGTIFACGGGYYPIYKPPSLDQLIEDKEAEIARVRETAIDDANYIEKLETELAELRQRKPGQLAQSVLVPDGAMEWLLHEVGHWIAASPFERTLPNYGDGHEIEAWAFEEIILGHKGPARLFAPPSQQDGTAFDIVGPIPAWAFRYIDRQIADERLAVEQFRILWSDWVTWGCSLGPDAPWRAFQ